MHIKDEGGFEKIKIEIFYDYTLNNSMQIKNEGALSK